MKHSPAPHTNEKCLQLTGSQMNLTSRSRKSTPKSPKFSGPWKTRPGSAFTCYSSNGECQSRWKRPMSADNDLSVDRILQKGSDFCNSNTEFSLREEIDAGPNFKHYYTFMSSNLLESLLHSPWNRDCSESISNSSDLSQSNKSLGCRIREMAQSNSDRSSNDSPDCVKNIDKSMEENKLNTSDRRHNTDSIALSRDSMEEFSTLNSKKPITQHIIESEISELRDLRFQRWFLETNKNSKDEEKIVRFSHENKEDELRSLINSEDEDDGEQIILKSQAELEYNPEHFISPKCPSPVYNSCNGTISTCSKDDNSNTECKNCEIDCVENTQQFTSLDGHDCRHKEINEFENSKKCSLTCPFSCCKNKNSVNDECGPFEEQKHMESVCFDNKEIPQTDIVADDNVPSKHIISEFNHMEKKISSDIADANDTTYAEIVNLINVLEQEETNSVLCVEKEEPCNVSSVKKNDELQEIYSYLDEVEKSSQEAIKVAKSHLETVQTTTQSVLSSISSIPRLEDLICKNVVELAQEVLSLKIQIEDQSNGIKLLQTTIAEMKEAAKMVKNNHEDEIFKITNEAEVAVQRHQKFIKQLLQEKKVLNEKVGKLVDDLKLGEDRYQKNLKTIEQRHAIEIQRVKETQAVAEKLKREKWIDMKTQKIKEMTVKGLEPELSRMAARQQQEMTELRNLHRAELEAVELRATRRTTELLDQLRSDLNKAKEEAILKETNALRFKLEQQFEEERNHLEHELRKLREERRREKELMESKEEQLKDAYTEIKRSTEREKEKERQSLIQEFQEQLETVKRRHQNELNSVRSTLELEKEAWMTNYKKQQATKFLEREAELHHQYKMERDRDVELVIERLENEVSQAQQELNQAAENKFKRMKEKFEEEIKEMELTENALKTKLSEAKSQLLQKEDQIADLNSEIHHLQCDLNHVKKLCQEMSAERNNLNEIIRKEYETQLDKGEKEQEELKNQIAALKTNHILELAKKDQLVMQAKTEAKQELTQVYNRVKLTVNKKEEALEALRVQHKTVLERCCHLEKMLENQRRNLLLK